MQRIPRPQLDVRDLELVVALAQTGSTVRASSVLHLTQSAISRALLAVEDKLAARLFERTARGLALTAAGHRLVAGASPLLAQLVDLESTVRTGATADTTPLRLVCECYTAYRWLPSALAALPLAQVHVALEHTHAPVPALLAGDVDVALLTTAPITGDLVEDPLFSDEIVFALAPSHPLASRATLGAADLARYPLITSTATPELERQWFTKQVFGRRRPRIQQLQFPLTEAVIDATRGGLGIAVLSEWVARPHVISGELVARSLRGKRLRRPWRIAYRPEAAARARQLRIALAGAPPRLG